MRIAGAGHGVFAATMMGLGILGLIRGDFTAIWQPASKVVPASHGLPYLCALISLVCGMALLWERAAVSAARVLLAYLLFWLLVFGVPGLLRGITVDVYWSLCKTGVLVASAWVLYVWFAGDWDRWHR